MRNFMCMNADTLKPLLESKGIKIAHLARDLGINKSTVSRWRQVPIDRLREVSRITGISVTDLRPDVPWGDDAKRPAAALHSGAQQ